MFKTGNSKINKIGSGKSGILLVLILVVINFKGIAQVINLSPQSRISIITPEPGEEAIFTIYGHNAIRVFDPVNQIDIAYDYGIFDFGESQVNFAVNFTKGYLRYSVGDRPFNRFAYQYEYFNRTIHEQELNLRLEEKQKLYEFLANNALPENKYYFYDYFYDNCATKVRDVLRIVLEDKLVFDDNYVSGKHSFRDIVDSVAVNKLWLDFGIDVCLGLPMDKTMSPEEYMFLPGFIYEGFAQAQVKRESGFEPIVKHSSIYFKATPESHSPGLFSPNLVFWTLFVLVLISTYLGLKKQKTGFAFDRFIFILFGLLGCFLLFLWFGTDHNAAQDNLNILWAIPFHLIAGILLFKYHKYQFLKLYFLIIAVAMGLLLITWPFNPQGYNDAFFPIILLLGLRAIYTYHKLKLNSIKPKS